MKQKGLQSRAIRTRVSALLESDDLSETLRVLAQMPVRKTIRPLLAAIARSDHAVRMRAAMALGIQVSRLAEEDMEAAREVVRRLTWSLNHESGSAGWGAPQAMAEIMLNHEGLAREYTHMLTSYMPGGGNRFEETHLQRDLLQGLGRLAQARREMLQEKDACDHLADYMSSEDAQVRGLAAWCAGILGAQQTRVELQGMLEDSDPVTLFSEGAWTTHRVKELALEALSILESIAQNREQDAMDDS